MLAEKSPSKKDVKNNKELSDKRMKYFIQMLDVKRDTNMTRIYSAIHQSDFFFSTKTS